MRSGPPDTAAPWHAQPRVTPWVTVLLALLTGYLLARGAMLVSGYWDTPMLANAVASRNLAIATVWLALGADPDRARWQGQPALRIAIRQGDAAMIELLAQFGATLTPRDYSPLHEADTPEVTRALLDHGANPLLLDRAGKTPLFGKTDLSVVTLLGCAGTPLALADPGGRTTLHYPLPPETAEFYLRNGVDPNRATGAGVTPLHIAVERGTPALVALLLDHGATPNPRDQYGRVPLALSDLEDARILLAHGADPNAPDDAGRAALHRAAERGDETMAQLLLAHGADVTLTDSAGQTAHDLALAGGHLTIADLVSSTAKRSKARKRN